MFRYAFRLALPVLFASLLPLTGFAAPENALQIGTVKEINGTATSYHAGTKVARSLQAEDVVFLGETVKTGQNSLVNIEFLDKTIFRVGADSEVKLDQYVYDPISKGGEMKAKVTKGVFRLVTGLIAKQNPENVEVDFPTGSMGIRGTDVLGSVGKNEILLVLYLSEDGAMTHHSVVARNNVGGSIFEVEIGTPGMGSIIKKGKKPTEPFVVSEEMLSGMEAQLGITNPFRKNAGAQKTEPAQPQKKSNKEKEEPVIFTREMVKN